jgi:hypothetical protein
MEMAEHLHCDPGVYRGFVSAHLMEGGAPEFSPCDGGEDVFIEGIDWGSCPPCILDTVGEERQIVVDCGGEMRRLGFILCGVESTNHSVVYHGDGGLGFLWR